MRTKIHSCHDNHASHADAASDATAARMAGRILPDSNRGSLAAIQHISHAQRAPYLAVMAIHVVTTICSNTLACTDILAWPPKQQCMTGPPASCNNKAQMLSCHDSILPVQHDGPGNGNGSTTMPAHVILAHQAPAISLSLGWQADGILTGSRPWSGHLAVAGQDIHSTSLLLQSNTALSSSYRHSYICIASLERSPGQ